MEDCTISDGLLAKEKGKGKEGIELEKCPQEIVENDTTPKEGMRFNSLEEVKSFYKNYAQCTGFGTKTRSTWRENGEVRKCVLSCVREGKCTSGNNCRYSTKMTGRNGCKAQINVRLYGDGLWHLTKVNLEHNHLVSPSKAILFRSNRKLNDRVKKQLELNDTVGIPVCKSFLTFATQAEGIEKLSFDEKDVRRWKFGEGDGEALRQYFMRMKKQNSNFFHLMDVDGEGRLRHVFWADARSRASYKYFGDVISFDTTYLINKYSVPFAPFVGVNHHGQSVLLGCGLLSSESIESYVWLFTAWLTCMSGRPPNAIITDQCKFIQAAVAEVFPRTRHRLYLWHIMNKVPEKLIGFKERKTIVCKLKKTVYDSLRVEEFEQSWREMIENFALQDNAWLKSLYEIRQKWVPVFVKDIFWAGMSTTQHSENMNAFFDSYVNSRTSLKQFISLYNVELERKYEDEALADFNSFHREWDLVSNLPMEKQLRTLYTSNMFKKFQEEVKNVVNCRCVLLAENGPISLFEVRERVNIEGISEPIPRKFEVCFNAERVEVHCICRSFEFRGILCNHAICVLDFKDVTTLPSNYILQRWRKDFKHLYSLESSTEKVGVSACAPMDRYDDIYMHCHEIAEMGSVSDIKYKFAVNAIKKLKEQLFNFDEENRDSNLFGSVGYEEIDSNRAIDPVHVKRKGRPRELRLQSTVEKVANAKKKKTRHNITNKLSSSQETISKQKVLEREVNNINQCDIPLTQGNIQIEKQLNSFMGTQESINIAETSTSIDNNVGVQPHYQGNHNFQHLMFQEYMRKF